jgi:hypothetical protein
MLRKKDRYDENTVVLSRHDPSVPPRTIRQYVIKTVFGGKVSNKEEVDIAVGDMVEMFNKSVESFHRNPEYEMAASEGSLKSIRASGEGKTAREKIMEALEAAVWYEVPIEIDEMITEEEFFEWKMAWYSDQEYRRNDYPGHLAPDLHEVKAILPNKTVVYGNGGLRRPAGSKRLGKFYMCWIS